MVTFRTLTLEEMPTAIQLWVDVFGVEAAFFQTLIDGDPADWVSLGAFEDDRLVSSVHVFMRWFRDRDATPLKVGGIGSVSTLPEARSKGYSSKLLQMAIKEMETRECVWSYLGTGVNDHYAKQGWRTVSTQCFRGKLKEVNSAEVLATDTVSDSLLASMCQVHLHCFRSKPMSNGRAPVMWDTAVRYRLTGANDEVFTQFDDKWLKAYLVTRRWEGRMEIVEAACAPGADAILDDLIAKRMAYAYTQGVRNVTSMIAEQGVGHQAFVSACSEVNPAEDRAWMVLPIANRITLPDLVALHADPRGRRSDLDNF